MTALTWPRCGDPRTAANTTQNSGVDVCLLCRRATMRQAHRRAEIRRREAKEAALNAVVVTPAMQLYRDERERRAARFAETRTAQLADAKRAFDQMLADSKAAQKGGRPKGSKTNAWHHAAEVEL